MEVEYKLIHDGAYSRYVCLANLRVRIVHILLRHPADGRVSPA
jgi:hypothetical protein